MHHPTWPFLTVAGLVGDYSRESGVCVDFILRDRVDYDTLDSVMHPCQWSFQATVYLS